jgi:hypothetical protein
MFTESNEAHIQHRSSPPIGNKCQPDSRQKYCPRTQLRLQISPDYGPVLGVMVANLVADLPSGCAKRQKGGTAAILM